jgi:FkbM family methyltransferase
MRDQWYNWLWGAGAALANHLQRRGLLGDRPRAILRRFGQAIVPAPSKSATWVLPNGMRMSVPAGFMGIRGYVTGVYEQDLAAVVRRIVQPGMTAVDLGALVGYYTLLLAERVGPQGRVYSFEAEPGTAKLLEHNVRLNDCPQVTVVPVAVSDSAGTAQLVTSRTLFGAPVGGMLSNRTDEPTIAVPTIALDGYFAQAGWPRIDFIKMDIDGAESAALRGMRELSRRNPRLVLAMELDPAWLTRGSGGRDDLAALLIELGFVRGRIVERRLRPFALSDGLPATGSHVNLLLDKCPP